VIEAHAFVERPPLALVIPECPERAARLQLAQGVGPSLGKQPRKSLTARRLNEHVIV
jgi:hypothetical protein